MKKQFKTILFSCFLLGYLFTAMPAKAQFSAGVRAGINFSTDSYNQYQHEELVLPYGGLFAQYRLQSPVDLQLGLNYTGEGSDLKDLGTGDTYNVRHNYLTIPLMVQYRFLFGGYVEVGPQLGILLNASSKTDGDASVDVKEFYKGTDFDLGIGFGYEFKHKAPNGLGISFRYLRGLSNINQASQDVTDVKTRNLNVGLTYRFGLSK